MVAWRGCPSRLKKWALGAAAEAAAAAGEAAAAAETADSPRG